MTSAGYFLSSMKVVKWGNMAAEVEGKPQFYMCSCFTTNNIYLDDYKLHVRFVSEHQFRQDYQAVSE